METKEMLERLIETLENMETQIQAEVKETVTPHFNHTGSGNIVYIEHVSTIEIKITKRYQERK